MQMNEDEPNQIFFSYYLQTITYMHEHKFFTPLNKENMHITLKFFSPFLSIINKGVKVKQNHQKKFSPPFCPKQRTKEGVIQINQ